MLQDRFFPNMLSFFRRILNSRVGVFFALAFLVIIGLAFAAGDINNFSNGGAAPSGKVADVGKADISTIELRQQVQNELADFRRQQPTLDMGQYIANGGFEGSLERLISGVAIEQFGRKIGLAAGKPMVDGQIAGIGGLRGLDGKFDQKKYEQLLQRENLTDKQIRANIARSIIAQQLTAPTSGATQVPVSVAAPYAALLLEKRAGTIGFIPTTAIDPGTVPTDAELADHYRRNLVRYTVPERRVIRYAPVDATVLASRTAPTDAEIAAAYAEQAQRFGASEKRSVSQLVIGDRAAADALVAKVKGGTPIGTAAKAIGLDVAKLTDLIKKDYATQTNAAIADAVFAAPRGGVAGPLQSPLGWTVVQVDSVQAVAAKSLAQARPDLVKEITADKLARTLAEIHDRVDDALGDNSTFAEIVADQKLQVVTTAPVTADGRNPDAFQQAPDPSLTQVIAAGFSADVGDDPQLVQIGTDGSFALVTLDKIVPSAAPPLARIREPVQRDFVIERARKKVRATAADVVAKANKGLPISLALAQTGLKLPPAQPLGAARAELAANPRGAPPPLALLFTMAEKTAKLLEAPNNAGYFVIYLAQIERHDNRVNPGIVNAMRADLGKVIGQEYLGQFVRAVRKDIGVKKNDASIAAVRKDLAEGR